MRPSNFMRDFASAKEAPLKDEVRLDMLAKARRASMRRFRRASTMPVRPSRESQPLGNSERSVTSESSKMRNKFRRYSSMLKNVGRKSGKSSYQKELEDCTTASEIEDDQREEAENENELHLACKTYPTVDAIDRITKDARELVSEENSLGQKPLHVAAVWGSSPRVVKRLLEMDEDVATQQDKSGRTPLHLACACKKLCDAGHKASEGSCARDLRKGPSYAVIKTLCQIAPQAVNIEDEDGMSALEYAICANINPKILRLLHQTSENAWTGRSNDGKFRRHSLVDLTRGESLSCVVGDATRRLSGRFTGRDSFSSLAPRKCPSPTGSAPRRRCSIPRALNL